MGAWINAKYEIFLSKVQNLSNKIWMLGPTTLRSMIASPTAPILTRPPSFAGHAFVTATIYLPFQPRLELG